MATEGFDLERRQELQSALSSLGAAVWAEAGVDAADLDKPLRRFLLAAGYPADVTRLVVAVLDRYGDEESAARAGVPARELASLVDSSTHSNTQRAAVPRALKAAGYPADLTRLVLTLLEKYGSVGPVEGVQVRDLASLVESAGPDTVKRTVKAADLPADVQRLVTLLVDAPAEGIDTKEAVKRVLKLAGQPPAVTRSVLTALDPPDDQPQEQPTLEELLKKAGYPAAVRRKVLAAIDPPVEVDVDPEVRVKDALKKGGFAPDVRRRVLAAMKAPAEADVDPEVRVKDALKKGGFAPDVRRRVLAAMKAPAEADVDPEVRVKDALKKGGFAPDVRRRVLVAMKAPAETVEPAPEDRVKDALKKGGFAPDVRRRVLAAMQPPAETTEPAPEDRVKDALKKGGFAPDVRRRVLAAIEPPAEGEAEVDPKRAVIDAAQRAGLSPEVRRRLLAAIDPPAEGEVEPQTLVKDALKRAGYAPDVRRRVLAAIEPPAEGEGEVDPKRAVIDVAKRAGLSPEVRRRVLAAIEPPAEGEGEVDPKRAVIDAAQRAGLSPEVRRRLLVAIDPPAEGEVEPETLVKDALKRAGYAPDVRRRVLAAIDPPAEGEVEPEALVKDALRKAGYAPDVRRRVLAAIDPPAEGELGPEDRVKDALRKAGYAPDVRRRVLAAIDPPAEGEVEVDPKRAVIDAAKRAGLSTEVRRRLLAAIDPPAEGEVEVDPKRAVIDAANRAGLSTEVRRRLLLALDPPGDDDGDVDARAVVRRTLRTTGYPADVVRFVDTLLERHVETEESDEPDAGLRVSDLQPLVASSAEGADVTDLVRRLLRVGGFRADLGQLVASLLERYGDPEIAESGLRIADLQPLVEVTDHDFDAREPVRRILRAAGYRVDLINFVELLLERYTGSDMPVSGVRIRDLSDLVEDTDEKLLALMRHWRTAAPDDHLLGNELATVLGRRGVEPEVARDLAAAIENDSGEGQLVELARVARFALSAEDACVSMAEPAWLEAPAFAKAYAEAKSISAWGRDIRWRVQTLVKAAAAARHVEGDFVECGVDTGGTARAVMAYLGDEAFAGRTFYLFDTFHGIVPEQLMPDEPAPIEDRYPDVADVARANFADKSYVRIVEGAVPETLSAFAGTQVAYLHIDMNAAYPEVEALKFFWNLLTPGAPVVFDDYGFPRHRAQRRALDDVAASLGVEIMMLPTCQGIVFKPPKGV